MKICRSCYIIGKILIIILFIISLNAISIVQTSLHKSSENWFFETVDTEGYNGRYTSIDVDSNKYPHISYCREDNDGYVKYAFWNGTQWKIYTLDFGSGGTNSNVMTTSIILDENDYPHIAYSKPPNLVNYTYWDGNQWNYSIVYEGSGIYGSVGIDLDSNGFPHISYCDGYGICYIRYAYWNGSQWINEIVDSSRYCGIHNSIKIDSNNCPHIAYIKTSEKSIRYANKTQNDSEWNIQTVDSVGSNYLLYPSIDLDSNQYPHIGYYKTGSNDLRYAFRNESSMEWNVQTIVSTGHIGYSYSLALTYQDYPYFMYQNIEEKDLEFIYWDGISWINGKIDTAGDVGCCSHIALDSDNYAHISYRDEESYNLKYARELNKYPITPSNPTPSDNSIDIEIDTILSWTSSGDPDGDNVTFDVYFGNTSQPSKIADNISNTWFDPGEMEYNTTYYWQIAVWDDYGLCNYGSEWQFTTHKVICGDIDNDGKGPDIADLVFLVEYMFQGGPEPPIMCQADVDANGAGPDIADLVYLVDYMFHGGPPPGDCCNPS